MIEPSYKNKIILAFFSLSMGIKDPETKAKLREEKASVNRFIRKVTNKNKAPVVTLVMLSFLINLFKSAINNIDLIFSDQSSITKYSFFPSLLLSGGLEELVGGFSDACQAHIEKKIVFSEQIVWQLYHKNPAFYRNQPPHMILNCVTGLPNQAAGVIRGYINSSIEISFIILALLTRLIVDFREGKGEWKATLGDFFIINASIGLAAFFFFKLMRFPPPDTLEGNTDEDLRNIELIRFESKREGSAKKIEKNLGDRLRVRQKDRPFNVFISIISRIILSSYYGARAYCAEGAWEDMTSGKIKVARLAAKGFSDFGKAGYAAKALCYDIPKSKRRITTMLQTLEDGKLWEDRDGIPLAHSSAPGIKLTIPKISFADMN